MPLARRRTPARRRPVPPRRPRLEILEDRLAPAVYTVDTVADAGAGSLRQAILDANGRVGPDEIRFAIPGAGVHTIAPASPLPVITDPVVLDATTQPGYAGLPLIELDGSNAGSGANGLRITTTDSVVRGLAINRFTGHGILLNPADGLPPLPETGRNLIAGNFIGLSPDGTQARANDGDGLRVESAENTIGGTTAADRNLISGNKGSGIYLFANVFTGGGRLNRIVGNWIGLDVTGTQDLGNGAYGVITHAVSGNTIGGTTAEERNVISGNGANGVVFLGDDLVGPHLGNRLLGNYLGTDKDGTSAVGNGAHGVLVQGTSQNTVGGTAAGAGNVISGSFASGVLILGAGGNLVQGNFIGTNAAGTARLPNGGDGVFLHNGDNNTIGGTTPGARNVISGNGFTFGGSGITFFGGSTGNLVQGNYLGTTADGSAPLGNADNGVYSNGDAGNTIGGTAAGAGNVISANGDRSVTLGPKTYSGVALLGSGASATLVQGNRIGTAADGVTPLGNNNHGVYLANGAHDNTVGGTTAGAGNTIAYNGTGPAGGAGVLIGHDPDVFAASPAGAGNAVLGNAIYGHARPGIELGPKDGPTPNDPLDADSGPNQLQNHPVLTAVTSAGGVTTVVGSLHSTPGTTYRVEFFGARNVSFSSLPTLLGTADVTTDASGDADFSVNFPFEIDTLSLVAATATDPAGNTSEFSPLVRVTPNIVIDDVSVDEGDAGETLVAVTVRLSGPAEGPVQVDYATADDTAVAGADYTPAGGTLSFDTGDTSKTFTVALRTNLVSEPDKAFLVNLGNATGAFLGDAQGRVVIRNDDGLLTIDDVSATEPPAGTTADYTFTVRLAHPSSRTVSVAYITQDGTAASGEDYGGGGGVLVFDPGEVSLAVTIPVSGDDKFEPDEQFFVQLLDASNAEIARDLGTGSVFNDDSRPTIAVDDVSADEGDGGTTTFSFAVRLSNPSSEPVSVRYTTQDGTALAGSDYETAGDTLTFGPGETTKTVTVTVTADTDSEPHEAFSLVLSDPVNATITDDRGQADVLNDDGLLSVADVSLAEGASGAGALTFTVRLAHPTSRTVTASFATADDTATAADNDYTPRTGTLTFDPGQTEKTVTVQVRGDLVSEPDEQFFLNLTGVTNARPASLQARGTILNDDPRPSLQINDVTAVEGNSGEVNFSFAVTLSNPSSQTVTASFTTRDGAATAADQDYTPVTGTLTFLPGETSKTVTVLVRGNAVSEGDETFFVDLSGVANADVARARGTGTILNDDRPVVSVADVSLAEGTGGTTLFTFTVRLNNPSTLPVSVAYATENGTAAAPGDFSHASGTLDFDPGVQTRTFSVSVTADSVHERDETFTVRLSGAVNALLGTATAVGTIRNDDPLPTLSVENVEVTEGNAGTATVQVTVRLSAASGLPVTVQYATVAGTATAGPDFEHNSGVLTFAPGETVKTVPVPVPADTLDEADETFFLVLSNPTDAAVPSGRGTVTIRDDDPPPALLLGGLTLREGDGAMINNGLTLQLSGPSGRAVTVEYATADGTAVAGTDYAFASGTVTFLPGETVQPVPLTLLGNVLDQPDRTFRVRLTRAENATPVAAEAVVTIQDDDVAGAVQFLSASYGIGETAGQLRVTVSRTGDAGGVSVQLTAGGTAVRGTHYDVATGTLTFAPGERTRDVVLAVLDTDQVEGPRTVILSLSQPTGGATLGAAARTTVTLLDNDGTPDQRYVSQLYHDLLGRPVEPEALAHWAGLLGGGFSRAQVAELIQASTEYRTRQVDGLYQRYLHRGADPEGSSFFVGLLSRGVTVEQVSSLLAGSEEYFQTQAGRTTDGFLNALYRDALFRSPDPSGRAHFTSLLAGGTSRTDVALAVVLSDEYRTLLLDREGEPGGLYQEYLRRDADAVGLAFWLDQLRAGRRQEEVIALFVASQEYASQAGTLV